MKTIGIREFLRGGYKDLTEPIMVMSHNQPLGIWEPTSEVNASWSSSYNAWSPQSSGTLTHWTTGLGSEISNERR